MKQSWTQSYKYIYNTLGYIQYNLEYSNMVSFDTRSGQKLITSTQDMFNQNGLKAGSFYYFYIVLVRFIPFVLDLYGCVNSPFKYNGRECKIH